MPTKSLIALLLIAVLLIAGCGGQRKVVKNILPPAHLITREQALEIANKKANELKNKFQFRPLVISEKAAILDSLRVIAVTDSDEAGEKMADIINKALNTRSFKNYLELRDKYLWFIYFWPDNPVGEGYIPVGGDLEIFINAENGEVILTLEGK